MKKLEATLFFMEEALSAKAQVGDNGDASYSLFLSGPSRIESLESLRLNCKLSATSKTGASVYQSLKEVFHNSLDPTFRCVGGFRSLADF